MPLPSSTPSIQARRRAIPTCASPTSRSTAAIRPGQTRKAIFRSPNCGGRRPMVGSGALPRAHGLPTNRSHRVTLETDCPEVVARCKADAVDAVILVPNCPVCHHSVSLAARLLEASGIATVVMGSAKDIVEHVGVPRSFSDFPLGNSAGRPHDQASQALTLDLALKLLAAAPGPRTTVQSPLRWSDDPAWKQDYCNAGLAVAARDQRAPSGVRRAEARGANAARCTRWR